MNVDEELEEELTPENMISEKVFRRYTEFTEEAFYRILLQIPKNVIKRFVEEKGI